MGNLMQLINKSTIIEEKAKAIASDIVAQYKRGEIKTQQELLYKTFIAIQTFYDSIGKPTMVKRLAMGGPSSIDYNDTMQEVYNDISIIIKEAQNLTTVLQDAYNIVTIDRQLLENRMNLVNKQFEEVKLKIENAKIKNVFMDSFINMTNFDSSACNLAPVTINTNFGYVSLNVKESSNVNEYASISITNDSNGFPGNTHQINIVNNEAKFIGNEKLHMNLAEILDNNSDTWFEYELYKISDDVALNALNLGFSYDEGRRWVSDDEKLTLGLIISFNKPELINTISMSPYIPSDKDAIASIINSIVISDGKGSIRELMSGIGTFDGDKVYSFPKQYCKTITIIFSQEMPYATSIGHFFFKELNNQNLDYFRQDIVKFSKRVDGPKPKIENLGITYNDEEQRYIQPSAAYGYTIGNEADIKNNLFKIPETDNGIKADIESLSANRFLTGIKDITVSNYSYNSTSEYVSQTFTSDSPITSVSLIVDDFVPEIFEDILDSDGNSIDWIQYSFSIDDGAKWFPLIPEGVYKNEGYNNYSINSGVPLSLRRTDIGYIEVAEDVYKIKLRIVINRPTDIADSEYYSPIVYEYKLQTS